MQIHSLSIHLCSFVVSAKASSSSSSSSSSSHDSLFYPFLSTSGTNRRVENACSSLWYCELGYADIESAKTTWKRAFEKHNQTLKTLRALGHSDFSKEEYWEFTRGDCASHLEADETVRDCLERMKFQKFVLTNCAEKEAKQALKRLNVLDMFQHVYGADFMGNACKPSKEAFEKVLRDVKRRMSSRVFAGDETDDEEIQPFETDRVFMFEDSLKNLVSAKENFNITGVLVKGKTLAEENGEEVAKRFIQINKPCVSELMEKAPGLFA